MNDSAHERYRSRLRLLADEAFVLDAIGESRAWKRRYARFEPCREPFAIMVFARSGRTLRVDVCATQTADGVASDGGWLRIVPFGTDERVTTLGSVLGQPWQWSVQRYLPGRRCTLRIDMPDGTVRYAKVYADDRGQRADAAGRLLWSAADLGFAVPRPDHWDAPTRTLWQSELPGSPAAKELYGPLGAHVVYRIGQANASLALSHIEPTRIFDANAQIRQSTELASELSWRIPALGSRIRELLDQLVAEHPRDSRVLRPIHGDPHPKQWLDLHGRLGLLDFESVAVGDPELDAAIFLAELQFEDSRIAAMEDLEAAYVAGAASAGLSLDAQRLRVYRAHKILAKALRSARAIHPEGDARAEMYLRQAAEALRP